MKINIRIFLSLVVLLIYCLLASGSGESDSEYRDTLRRSIDKSQSGAPMTKQEKSTYNSYKNWEKEYDANQYNKNHYGK